MNDIIKSAIVLTTTAALSGFSLGVANNIATHSGTQAKNKSALSQNQQSSNQNQLPDSLSNPPASPIGKALEDTLQEGTF